MSATIAVTLVGGASFLLHSSQVATRRGVDQRFTAKAGLSAEFASTYVSQLTAREVSIALRTVAGADPSAAFAADVNGFGFQAAVLLDNEGRVLAVAPTDPTLIGTPIGPKYTHLAAALQGHVAVSNTVASAARAAPVVAFAVPFQTPAGERRVFSGAYIVNETPLGAFLSDAVSLRGAQLYLTDGRGTILATNGVQPVGSQTLQQRNPRLAQAVGASASGSYKTQAGSVTYAQAPVAGTSWQLAITVPSRVLLAATEGPAYWLPWLIVALMSLLIVVAAWLAVHLLDSRRSLAATARTDALTGLSNRGHLAKELEHLLANASRHGFALAVLMVDVDYFKQLNDTYGHQAGDRALRQIATRMSDSLRQGDLIARWGGEEFLIVLPFNDLPNGLQVGERLCRLVADEPVDIGSQGRKVPVQVSIGVAQACDDSLEALVHRADLALYQAKAAGRNRACTHGPDLDPERAVRAANLI